MKSILLGLLTLCGVMLGCSGHAFAGTPQPFEKFRTAGMRCTDGLLPVYVVGNEIYLELPASALGRELCITAQVDSGFDLVGRAVKSLGVVRVRRKDESTVAFQRPFYNERVLDRSQSIVPAFDASNVQPDEQTCPIVACSERGGLIVNISSMLLVGTDWFDCSRLQQVGNLRSDLSRLLAVHAFGEGVSFTMRHYYSYSDSGPMLSNMMLSLPSGYLPLTVTCVVRLLPEKDAPLRLADGRIPYQALKFKDYSQDPYTLVDDSLILHWNLEGGRRTLTCYIDSLCPPDYVAPIREGVLAWNEAFRKAGLAQPLRVEVLKQDVVSAEQPLLVAYDLEDAVVSHDMLYHPRSGEILQARIHIGYGCLSGKRERYWLQCGAVDSRVWENPRNKELERELLKAEIMKQMGAVLGLASNLSGSACYTPEQLEDAKFVSRHGYSASVMDELPYNYLSGGSKSGLRIGEDDVRAIYFGYVPVQEASPYAHRERMRAWLGRQPARLQALPNERILQKGDLSSRPSDAAIRGLGHLFSVVPRLEELAVSKDGSQKDGQMVVSLYK